MFFHLCGKKVSNPHKTIGKITVPFFMFFLFCILSQYNFLSSIDRKLMCSFQFQSLLFHLDLRNGICIVKLKRNRHKASPFFRFAYSYFTADFLINLNVYTSLNENIIKTFKSKGVTDKRNLQLNWPVLLFSLRNIWRISHHCFICYVESHFIFITSFFLHMELNLRKRLDKICM